MSPGWRSGFLQGGIASWRTRSYREMCEPWSRFLRMDTGSDTAWHRAVWAKRKFWGWDPSANFYASEKWFQPFDKSRFCVELKEKAQALPGLVIYPPKQLEIIFCVKKKWPYAIAVLYLGGVFVFSPCIYFESTDPTYLKHLGTHMVNKVFFSFFNLRKRTFATAESCCLQRAMPRMDFFVSLKEDKTCSSSTRLPVSFVLLLCNSPQISSSIKHKIDNL